MIKLFDFECKDCKVVEEHYLDNNDPWPKHCLLDMTVMIGGSKRVKEDKYNSKCGDVFKEKTKHWYEPHRGLEGIDLSKGSKI